MKKTDKTKTRIIHSDIIHPPRPKFYQARDTKWLTAAWPSNGRIVGIILGLSLVLPLPVSTFLERGFGDNTTVLILMVTILVAGIVGIILSRIRFALIPLALLFLILGAIFSIVITMTMDW